MTASRTVHALMVIALLTASPLRADVVINELMAKNRGAHVNASGDDRSDWVELHNNGGLPVDLTGWHLSDDPFDLIQWQFPTSSIPAGGYLLIYADNASSSTVSGELHANFALSSGGETLALVAADSNTIVDAIEAFEYSPGQFGYPPQTENISYGRNASGGFSFYDPATPGAVNAGGAADFVDDTRFSHDRGFYSNAFVLTISSHTPDAAIYFTLNGAEPDMSSSLYTNPIAIGGTTCVRARAYKTGLYPTDIDTQTYIFVDDVIVQSPTNNVPPTPEWPSYDVNGQKIQYGMDPDVTGDPSYAELMDDALLAIPTLSLVTDLDKLFDPSVGIYVNANSEGDLWERVSSVELLNPDGTDGFQEDAGLRIRGGWSRNSGVPKHAFRLRFRREYGASQLNFKIFGPDGAESSNGVDLRCAATPAWSANNPHLSTHVRDIFSRDMQLAMGHPSTRGDHYHLYLNGVYWGMYQTQEHIEGEFAEAYLGGDKDDYDIIEKKKHGYKLDGSHVAYSNLWEITQAGYASHSNYFAAQALLPDGLTPHPTAPKLLDVENLMDFMLINYYTGEKDGAASVWATVNNYAVLINREKPDGLKHFEYDSEWSLGIGVENVVGPINRSKWNEFNHFNGHYLHEQLVANPEYVVAFGDRTHARFFNGGLMMRSNAVALLMSRVAEIDTAIIAESARWGDALEDDVPYTRNLHWRPAISNAVEWMEDRGSTVISQLRGAGWYPALDAPVFSQHGGTLTPAFQLSMSGPGTIVYTLDGSDPRERFTGVARGATYSTSVPLSHGVIVKARSMTGTNDWSALTTAVFVAPGENPLRISEVMYNPRRPSGVETNNGASRSDFEYVEIHNPSSNTVGLAGMMLRGRFSKGVSFDFTGSAVVTVPPFGYVLVPGDVDAFARRYSTNGLLMAGSFSGNLDDGGDTVELISATDERLADFSYGDGREWPLTADGAGHSLIPLVSDNQTGDAIEYGPNWRACTYLDGSPGAADPVPLSTVRLNEIEAHTDYDNPTPPYDAYDSNDGIELYNTSAGSIGLNGWFLSDDKDELKKWPIPNGTSLSGLDWIHFDEVSGFHNPITNGFGLNKAGETVYLSYLPGTSDDRVADAVRFEAQANGQAWGRVPDGTGYWATCTPTTNAANLRVAAGVVINEIMYHPLPSSFDPGDNKNDEYVELCNRSDSARGLFNDGLTWRLTGAVDFAFPTNTTLAAGECVVVVPSDPEDPLDAEERIAFLKSYRQVDGEVRLFGPFEGSLANSSERVTLEQPQAPDAAGDAHAWIVADEVVYADRAPWPVSSDGGGVPLQRWDAAASGKNPTSWYAPGFASPGVPDRRIDLMSPSAGETLLIPALADLSVAIDEARVQGSITSVEFLLDGSRLSLDTVPPYAHALSLSDISTPGAYTLQVRLEDAGGSYLSRPIPIETEFAPRVRLTEPSDGQSLLPPYTRELLAELEEDLVVGSVSQIAFYRDGVLLGTDETPPYTWAFSEPVVPGTYAFTAVMADALATSTSPVVRVSVFTNAPQLDLSAVPDHSILHGNGTRLDAVLDLNGLPPDLVSLEWTQVSGPGSVSFTSPDAPATSASFSLPGDYLVQLTVRYGAYSYELTRTIRVQAGNTANTLRYEEPFEGYLQGAELLGINGWSGTTPPTITNRSYTLPTSAALPILYAEHTQVLALPTRAVTNAFTGTGAYTSLWIDSVCELSFWRNPVPPAPPAAAHLHVYLEDDGYLRLWHCPDPVNHPGSNAWSVLSGQSFADASFHRLTVHADYQRDANGYFHFELFVDGTQITHPTTRFACANTNNNALTRLILSGPAVLDDLVIDSRSPLSALYLIQASAGANGSIGPSASIYVEAGGSQVATISPNQFFHIADVLVDQVSVGPVASYPFSSVTTNHEIEAVFAPDLATNDTPHWWLHSQNPAWSNDFDAAALGNVDGDPVETWREYLAGTDPFDPYSYQSLSVSNFGGGVYGIAFPATSGRRYRLQRRIAELGGPWVDVHVPMLGPSSGGTTMNLKRTNAFDRVFYRIRVDRP